MYDFTFLIAQEVNVVNGLGGVRQLFEEQFGGQEGVRLKSVTITQVMIAGKIVGTASSHYLVVGLVESDNKLLPNKPDSESVINPDRSISPLRPVV
jgi:hypothetical protein